MRKFILQECKRVLIKKKIPLIIIFIVIIGFGLVNVLNTKSYEQQLKQSKASLYNLKSARDQAETAQKKAAFEKDIKDYEDQIEGLTLQLNFTKNYDKSKVDEQIEKLKKQNNPKNEYTINQLKYCKEHNIQKSNLTSQGTYTSLGILYVFSIFIPIIFIVILSDIISGEYKPNTIKNLIIKPISKKKIIISKFIVSIIFNIGIVVLSALIFFVEGGICLGFSGFKLPFDVGARYVLDKSLPLTQITSQMKYVPGSRTFISMLGGFIILMLIIIIISIAVTSIIMFISAITKNAVTAAICCTILFIGSRYYYLYVCIKSSISAAKQGVFCKFFLVPYSAEPISVLTGDISQKLSTNISMSFFLLVCLFWFSIMMFLSVNIFKKREFD